MPVIVASPERHPLWTHWITVVISTKQPDMVPSISNHETARYSVCPSISTCGYFQPDLLPYLLHGFAFLAKAERFQSAPASGKALKPSSPDVHMTVQSKGRQQQQQSPPPGRGHSQHLGLLDLMPAGLMIDSTDSAGLMKFTGS